MMPGGEKREIRKRETMRCAGEERGTGRGLVEEKKGAGRGLIMAEMGQNRRKWAVEFSKFIR